MPLLLVSISLSIVPLPVVKPFIDTLVVLDHAYVVKLFGLDTKPLLIATFEHTAASNG